MRKSNAKETAKAIKRTLAYRSIFQYPMSLYQISTFLISSKVTDGKKLRESLNNSDKIVFESTGLTVYFDRMLKDLRRDFSVVTIGIRANDDLCLKRVKTRDLSIHINVSDDEVNEINRQVKEKKIKTDFTITNENKSAGELTKEITEIIK